MKIFIDFDRTLIDSSRIRQDVCPEFDEEYEAFRKDHPFSVVGFSQYLTELGRDGDSLPERFYAQAKRASEYVFDDAVDFLKALRDAGHQPILLSFSPEIDDWQKPKIEYSGLLPFLDDIHITNTNKVDVIASLQLDQPFIFIDDKQSEIEAMQTAFPNSLCLRQVVGAPLMQHLDVIETFVNKT